MINPITQLLLTRREELNAALVQQEILFRKGKISFEVYNETTKEMIKNYYKEQERMNAMTEGDDKDINKDTQSSGLFGIIMRVIKKIF